MNKSREKKVNSNTWTEFNEFYMEQKSLNSRVENSEGGENN